jgi:hypothetical protein
MLNRQFMFISAFVFLFFWGLVLAPMVANAEGYTMGLGCIYPSNGQSVNLSMVTHGEDQQTNVVAQVTSEIMKPVNLLGVINNSIMALAGVGGEALGGDRSESVMCNSMPVGEDYNSSLSFRMGDRTDTKSLNASGGKTKVAIDGPVTIDWQRTKSASESE